MAKYVRVTGKILSRDSYREDVWDPEQNAYTEKCMQTVRVEYNVNGRIYTHNFTGEDAHGEAGEDYALFYREDAPENVKTVVETEMNRMYLVIPLIVVVAGILIWLLTL